MSKKSIFLVLLSVVLVGAIIAIASSGILGQSIKIGVVASLSGQGSVFGISAKSAILLAEKELGKTNNRYRIIFADDTSNTGVAGGVTDKLIKNDKVSAIIAITSGTGKVVRSIAEPAGIPVICVACADETIGRGDLVYTNALFPQDQASGWLAVAQDNGVKKIAIITQDQPGINVTVDEIEKQVSDFGIKIVYKNRYSEPVEEFSQVLADAKKTGPDTYLIMGYPPSLDILGQEFIDGGVKSVSSTLGAFVIANDPTIFDGFWYADVNIEDNNLRARYEKEFPNVEFMTLAVPYAYDSLNILVDAFESEVAPTKYLSDLQSYNGEVTLTKVPGTNAFRSTLAQWVMKDGVGEIVK